MKKQVIIETDIGGDPDDFYAILYMLHTCDVKAILVSPGFTEQIRVVNGLLKYCNKEHVLVGSPKVEPGNYIVGSVVKWFLNRYQCDNRYELSEDILDKLLKEYPDIHLFGIGPLNSIGPYLSTKKPRINTICMQGGFVQHSLYRPQVYCEKFEGVERRATYNLGGNIAGADYITDLNSDIGERYFIGKTVCHPMVLDRTVFDHYKQEPTSPEMKLFNDSVEFLIKKSHSKIFHDPVAACIYNNLDIALFLKGYMVRNKLEWSSVEYELGYNLCVDCNTELVWERIFKFT